MTSNAIAQSCTKVVMVSHFLGLVGSLTPSEQFLWFPNQSLQDLDTWTLPHLIQLKEEYNKLTVTLRIQELPQTGESLPVLSSSQRTLSRQIMKFWQPWKVTIESSQNTRMLEQMNFRTQLTINATTKQDLNPRPCADNTQSSVWVHDMMTIELGDKPFRILTWKPTTLRSHTMCHSHHDRFPISLWEDMVLFHPRCSTPGPGNTSSTMFFPAFST